MGPLSLLAYLLLMALLVIVLMLIPRPRVVLPLGVILAAAGLSVLLLDTLVFAENRYMKLLAPHTWVFLVFYFLHLREMCRSRTDGWSSTASSRSRGPTGLRPMGAG